MVVSTGSVPQLRRLASGTIAGVALLGLVGCGSNGAITTSGDAVPSAGVESGALSGPMTVQRLQTSAQQTADVSSGRLELRFGDDSSPVVSTAEFSGGVLSQTFSMSEDSAAGSIETIIDDEYIYVRGDVFDMFAQSESGWVKVPAFADGITDLFGSAIAGPEIVKLLDGAYGEVTEVGADEVRGEAVTHYRVAVDSTKVLDRDQSADPEDLGALDSVLEKIEGGSDLIVDVWVDGDGLVRRLASGEGDAVAFTLEIWDVGSDIEIEVPTDASEFDLGSLGSLFGEN